MRMCQRRVVRVHRDGRLVRVVDRTDFVWAELDWDGDRLQRLAVPGAVVDGALVDDELLGRAHTVGDTALSAIDWARPTEIPAIAAPGALALGSGGAIMNVIAMLAEEAGVETLQYAGPYPTSALWKTLARSFSTTGSEEDFTRDLWPRAARLARERIAIDFAPAPHERIAIAGGHVEVRDGVVERATIDGVVYEAGGSPARLVDAAGEVGGWPARLVDATSEVGGSPARLADAAGEVGGSPARLVDAPREAGGSPARLVARGNLVELGGPHRHCEVWFGDAPYARVATLAADGRLVERWPMPRCESRVVGTVFPPALVEAIAEVVADLAPAPLAADTQRVVAGLRVAWADLGARAASLTPDGIAVHAALWDRVGAHGLARLALAIAEAIAPVAVGMVVRRVLSSSTRRPP
jgi:hypothetical protein